MTDVRTLQDKQEITELCYKYGRYIDGREWDKLAEVFTEDAVADYLDMPRCDGRQAIQDVCTQALGRLDASQHIISNVLVSVDGDRAESFCYLQAQHVVNGTEGGDTFIIAGRYLDEVVRTPEGWRISYRKLEAMWSSGNPAVVGA